MGDRLVDLSVARFVNLVSTADQPVPAGASVAALTGATSAALVALVCDVFERRAPGSLAPPLESAKKLRQQLLELLDQDAAAFVAFLHTEPGSSARETIEENVAAIPLRIGRTCLEVLELVRAVEAYVRGPTRLDVGTASKLARAAAESSLDIAAYNLRLVSDSATRQALQTEIVRLRENSL
jgi:formiminotetrahydrofolate cyclodeaminase